MAPESKKSIDTKRGRSINLEDIKSKLRADLEGVLPKDKVDQIIEAATQAVIQDIITPRDKPPTA
jgi:hypothetical protein